MKKALVPNTTMLSFTFAVESGVKPVIFDYAKASDENRDYAEVHGWIARIGDTAASCKTEAERATAVQALIAHYESGTKEWNVRAMAKVAPINPAFVKIAALRKCTYEAAQAWYNEKLIAEMQAMVDSEQA